MTRVSPLETMILLFGLTLLAGLGALALLGSAAQTVTVPTVHQASTATIDWLRPDQVYVPSGLAINTHAAKHHGDTERIYANLLQGKCAEVAKFCGGSKAEMMYACVDPLTGLVGIMLQFGDEVTTGYFARNSNNLRNRISRENWEVCR